VDVTDTESIAAAVAGTAEWVSQTGKPLGGIIPAAGVGNPGLVCISPCDDESHVLHNLSAHQPSVDTRKNLEAWGI
jgi:hypothetical protein